MTPLGRLAVLPSLPLSARFIEHARSGRPLAVFPRSARPSMPIGALCLSSPRGKVGAGPLDEPLPVLDLEHAGPFGEVLDVPVSETIGSTRVLLDGDHLITTRLRPYLRKTLAAPSGRALASPEWIPLRLNVDVVRPRFLQLVLLSEAYGRLSATLSTGKQHPRISEDAFHRIEVPRLTLEEQDAVLARVEPLFEEALGLTRDATRIERIVDPVFHDAFGLDPAVLHPEAMPRTQRVAISSVAGNRDARFSWRYHAPEVDRARRALRARSRGVLAEHLAEPALLGHSAQPAADYEPGSGRPYVTMAALRRWRLDTTPCPELSEAYVETHASRRVAIGDVLMARSGEGTIGKVAIVDREVEGCFADFVIRLRADPARLLPAFLRFALTSAYYQMLVFGEKKGLGNNTNIFPSQLHAFPWLDVSLAHQAEIVQELEAAEAELERRAARATALFEEAQARLITGVS